MMVVPFILMFLGVVMVLCSYFSPDTPEKRQEDYEALQEYMKNYRNKKKK